MYVGGNPVNAIDPSGQFELGLGGELAVIGIEANLEAGHAIATLEEGEYERRLATAETQEYADLLTDEVDELEYGETDALAENTARGRQFETNALRAKSLPKNTATYQAAVRGQNVDFIPDSYQPGTQMTEVKDVEYQYASSQIRAEIAEAQRTGSQFRMIVNKATELSKPLVRLLKNTNSIVEEFDQATKTFITRVL